MQSAVKTLRATREKQTTMRWQSQLEDKQKRAEFEKCAVENNTRTMRSIRLEKVIQC